MSKFLVLGFLLAGLSNEAVSQSAELACSPAIGSFADQSAAILRTGANVSYSLTAKIEKEVTLADGNVISGFTTSRQVRDSKGRTRIDEPLACGLDQDDQPKWLGSVAIDDPIAKTKTLWNESLAPTAKTATVTHVPYVNLSLPQSSSAEYSQAKQVSQVTENLSPEAKRRSQQIKVEDLGKRSILGLEAVGVRVTRTWPPQSQGNSLPLVYVEEKWVTDKYGIVLLDIKVDPVFGKTTYEVTTFSHGEPAQSLFKQSADYKTTERVLSQ